jgi:micrococcal nuclease
LIVIGGAGPGVKAMRRAYRYPSLPNLSRWRCGAAVLTILAAGAAVSSVARADLVSPSTDCLSALSQPERRAVADINDGDTLTLTDGTVVRLIGTKAPAAPLGWHGDRPWPLVDDAKAALSQLASGAEVELRYGGRRLDRHDHALAQVFAVKGEERVWLQGELVARGLARVYSFPDNHACITELLARESEARAKHAGVWGVSTYRILAASDLERLGRLTRSYQLVEGVVAAVGDTRDRTYLNFDRDWHHDFTIVVERKDQAAMKAQGLDVKALAGKHVRVRGWIEWRNGPTVRVTHVEQLEVLPDAPAGLATPGAPVVPHRDRPAPAPDGIAL